MYAVNITVLSFDFFSSTLKHLHRDTSMKTFSVDFSIRIPFELAKLRCIIHTGGCFSKYTKKKKIRKWSQKWTLPWAVRSSLFVNVLMCMNIDQMSRTNFFHPLLFILFSSRISRDRHSELDIPDFWMPTFRMRPIVQIAFKRM